MNLYKRYIEGDFKGVYQDISNLDQEAFSPDYMNEIDKVLTETFQRISFNLDIIYTELKQINYLFNKNAQYNFERPLHKPLTDTDNLLKQLDSTVKPFGYIPLSLKYFYSIVGGVNFVWDYDTNKDFLWDMADPIQIASLDAVIETVTDKWWREDIQQYVDDENFDCAFLELASDALHKDNVSGGPAYSLKIISSPAIDAPLMNEPHNTTLIDYLRICIDSCGFPGMEIQNSDKSYLDFYHKVKPNLKPI